MTFDIIVEGVVTAIEILHLIVFFEAANDNGHSVLHSPNQGISRAVRFPGGYEFSQTFQFAKYSIDYGFPVGPNACVIVSIKPCRRRCRPSPYPFP